MRISRIELRDFRSIGSWAVDPHPALTILVGPNATGKTNTLEAVHVVCSGGSFRRPRWVDLVKWETPAASVLMRADGEVADIEVSLVIDNAGQRTWKVGGSQRKRTTEATRFVPTVVFTPEDLSMVKGPAEHRRASLDSLGEQLSGVYGALRRDYTRVIRHRNTLLRDGAPPAALEPWDLQLVSLGARLYTHRRRLLKRVAVEMRPIYTELSGGETLGVALTDRCGVNAHHIDEDIEHEAVTSALASYLATRARDECDRGVTLVGPHRDDVTFTIDGADARTFASQGQQRTIALAWKLAEVRVVTTVLSRKPVLLLDDVMSELDASRRTALTELIQQDIQTFVTTTNTGYFDAELLDSALIVPMGVAV